MSITFALTTGFIILVIVVISHLLRDKHIRRNLVIITTPDHELCREKFEVIDPVTYKVFSTGYRSLKHCIPRYRK